MSNMSVCLALLLLALTLPHMAFAATPAQVRAMVAAAPSHGRADIYIREALELLSGGVDVSALPEVVQADIATHVLYRANVYYHNAVRAEQSNRANNGSAHFSARQNLPWSLLTPQEFRTYRMGLARVPSTSAQVNVGNLAGYENGLLGASTVDWTGCISPIKDQGQCGSCWAFASTEAVEAAVAISAGCVSGGSGTAPILSPQQTLSCLGTAGCGGGDPAAALQNMIGTSLLTTDSNIPYSSGTTQNVPPCQTAPQAAVVTQVATFATNPKLLRQGPITAAVDATALNLQTYTGGIIQNCPNPCGTPDHAIQLVGYDGINYNVRNSWNTGWGEQGFFRMTAGVDCGCVESATQYIAFPTANAA